MSPREPLPDPLFTDVVLPPLFKGVDDAGANLVKELAHAMVSAFNAIAGQAATAMDIVQASVKGVGGAIQEGVKIILGAEAAANIDLSGDLFAFIGSLQDVIIDERLLTSGPPGTHRSSRQKTSRATFESATTRLLASDSKPTVRPSPEIVGPVLGWLRSVPSEATLTRRGAPVATSAT